VDGSEFIMEADMVITAVGQSPDLSFLPDDSKLQISLRGTIVTDENSLATNIPGVFAGGDVSSGPASVIEAIGDGKKAAAAIDCYLRGVPYPVPKPAPGVVEYDSKEMKMHLKEVDKEDRVDMQMLSVEERKGCTKEVCLGFSSEEEAIREARRCLLCRNSGLKY